MMNQGIWTKMSSSDICPVCGTRVKILNGDVQFSMEVHLQSHKSEETIVEDIDRQLRLTQGLLSSAKKQNSNLNSSQSKQNVGISNKDVSSPLNIYDQKHMFQVGVNNSEDQLSNKSDKSTKSEGKIRENKRKLEGEMTLLDAIFSTMPPGLQSHREFVVQNETSKVVCNLCKINIESKFNISEHLKTKSHEDNVILSLKEKLPVNLHEMLQFVSFYGSNLCCNLCRCKIDLCSNNLYETIVNIMVHNSSEAHSKKRTYDDSSSQNGEVSLVLKSLALINPLFSENKHMISYKMKPQFQCTPCNKNIEYHEGDKELMKNFVLHFNSSAHKKRIDNISVLKKFVEIYPLGKHNHNFIVSKNGISCTVCKCNVEANLEKIVLHTKQQPSVTQTNAAYPPTSNGSSGNMKEDPVLMPTVSQNTLMTTELNFKALMDSLPNQLKNIKCITENEQGQLTCLICKCIIPPSTYNLQTHLLGNKHKKNTQTSSNFENIKPTQQSNLHNQASDKPNNTKSAKIEELFHILPRPLQENAIFIKNCPDNQLFCSVCNLVLSANSKNLQQHLEGSQHVSSLKSFKEGKKDVKKITEVPNANDDSLLNNVMETDKVIKSFIKYLEKKDENYVCKLCKSTIVRSYDEQLFKANLMSHATGQKHKKNLSKIIDEIFDKLRISDYVIGSNSIFLKKQDEQFYCTLCKCTIRSSVEEEHLRKSLKSHLTGNKHANQKEKVLNPNAMSSSSTLPKVSLKDPIIELFETLPVNVQDDIQYIKRSTINGYLTCNLCTTTIKACYLREHLEEKNHVERKVYNVESFNLIEL